MVIIDKYTDKCYENLSNRKAASLIGVNRMTIHRWKLKANFKDTERWLIYFHTKKV